jgi:acetyltransferase-like isoleucine patch superfamily enzyme/acyl carrier protein
VTPPWLLDRALSRIWLRDCSMVGAAPALEGRPWVDNRGRLEIGARLVLSSRPVQSHLVVARGASLILGDDVSIAQGAAIAAHRFISIGDGARIGPFAVISDTDFHVAGKRDARSDTAPVVIGCGVRLGSRVTVLRGSSIGDGARVTAGSVVAGVIAAGAVVAGVPARAVSRAGLARLPDIVASVLGLSAAPGPGTALTELRGWDSLSALRVLLAIEEAFAVILEEGAVARARDLAELSRLVEAARLARSASACRQLGHEPPGRR